MPGVHESGMKIEMKGEYRQYASCFPKAGAAARSNLSAGWEAIRNNSGAIPNECQIS
jgi:hypothetical protein